MSVLFQRNLSGSSINTTKVWVVMTESEAVGKYWTSSRNNELANLRIFNPM